jgi:hypothetical protein
MVMTHVQRSIPLGIWIILTLEVFRIFELIKFGRFERMGSNHI